MAIKKKAVRKRKPVSTTATLESKLRDANCALIDRVADLQNLHKQLENERIAREASEQQCKILSVHASDYARLAAEIGEVGDLLRCNYSDEIQRGLHVNQTLAQVLWQYLKFERRYRWFVNKLETDELLTTYTPTDPGVKVGIKLVFNEEIKTMIRKPWLARIVRWMA